MQFLFDEAEFVARPLPEPRPRDWHRFAPWRSSDIEVGKLPNDPPWPVQNVHLRLLAGGQDLLTGRRLGKNHVGDWVDLLTTARMVPVVIQEAIAFGDAGMRLEEDDGPRLSILYRDEALLAGIGGYVVSMNPEKAKGEWREFVARVRETIRRLTPTFGDLNAPRWQSPDILSRGPGFHAKEWIAWLDGRDELLRDHPRRPLRASWLENVDRTPIIYDD